MSSVCVFMRGYFLFALQYVSHCLYTAALVLICEKLQANVANVTSQTVSHSSIADCNLKC